MEKYRTPKDLIESDDFPFARSKVYELFHTAGFPALRIGRKLVVSETALREWLERQASEKAEEV